MRIILGLLMLAGAPAHAAERLTVVELYTSQGCSSCPPAEALLAELSQGDARLLALGFHVTYWDRLGWKDPYSLAEATARQHATRARFGLDYVYTPQLVVDGRRQAVGSDRGAVRQALAEARASAGAAVAVDVAGGPAGIEVRVGAGAGRGTVLLVGFDRSHSTVVRAGENAGRTLQEVNVVRGVAAAGPWSGDAAVMRATRPAGERVAALLQADDGAVLGAALLP